MIVKFDNITVNIENPVIQKRIKNFILRAKDAPDKVANKHTYMRWTDEDKEFVRAKTEEGVSPDDIAKELGRTPHSVKMFIYKENLAKRETITL